MNAKAQRLGLLEAGSTNCLSMPRPRCSASAAARPLRMRSLLRSMPPTRTASVCLQRRAPEADLGVGVVIGR